IKSSPSSLLPHAMYTLRLITHILFITLIFLFFFFNNTSTTEIYTLSLHDALPISGGLTTFCRHTNSPPGCSTGISWTGICCHIRSEEHTSELQSHLNLVCRLLLEKKKKK